MLELDLRKLEKSKKYGYLFWIWYDGTKFTSFDENKNKISVKSEFKRILNELGITWAKGVQQSARTDSNVSATENILYISSNFNGDIIKLKSEFNNIAKNFGIIKIEKTISGLVLPDIVEGRAYEYSYPLSKLNKTIEEIKKICEDLSGEYDVSKFSDEKGKKLKQKIRKVKISYDGEKFIFEGNSFMPKQIRIMLNYIVKGELKPANPKYLTLKNINLKKDIENLFFKQDKTVEIENVLKVEKLKDIYFLYVNKEKRGEIIGKNGKNIKSIKKKLGKVIVKDV
ncbi:pseudouridylate synthase [Haliovirga abyssi]|uniref:Pseudouridylate synthase n=1 Tax=Haliovirga abyssi TaxID=2996794 RepID=A0AAU9DI34_9FUSO|nr:pseudouridylate synthase [Haliovirga abyssi]BDU51232.1 hypothetical protein HLVA_18010 [Haliovirga abyssi]